MGSLHKWFLLFLILVLPVFVAKQYHLLRDKKGASYVVDADFYHANPYNPNDKQFIIMMTSHNVAPFIERSLESVFKQNYSHYRLVLLDQDSTDGTYEKAVQFISRQPVERKIELIRRSSEGALFQAYYQIVKEAHDHDIIVHLPGGDWLSNEHTLATLNQIYRNQDVWLTYPQYIEYPSYKKGVLKALPKKHLHKRRVHRTPWAASPLKTFYAGILKQVELESGTVSFAEGEQSLMLPMAEIGKSHVRFISEVLYIHTSKEDLEEISNAERLHGDETDVILFSLKGGQSLAFSLQALETHLMGRKRITVIKEGSQFKAHLLAGIKNSRVLFTTDKTFLKHPIDLNKCARLLKENRAYGCYFHLKVEEEDLKASPPRFVDQGVYIWDMHRGKGAFRHPDGLHTAFYDRTDLVEDLHLMEFSDFSSLVESWHRRNPSPRRGLLFCDGKLPLY